MNRSQSPLIGRGHVAGVVRRTLAEGRSALLCGPAGIGKSRLSLAVLGEPAQRPRVVASLVGMPETSAISLATMGSRTRLPTRSTPTEVYAALLERWTAQCDDPLVHLDDAHHADSTTAAVLRMAVEAGQLQLVACQRVPHDLPTHLEALLSSGAMDRITIEPLTGRDIGQLVASAASTPLPETTVERILSLSAGNPLYARELAHAAVSGDPESDSQFDEVLERLVGRAVLTSEPDERKVLELVAVAGSVPLALLAPRRDAVVRLRRRGLLVGDADRTVRIDHPLRREWVLQDVGELAPSVLGGFLDEVGADAARALVATALARADPTTALRLLATLQGPDLDGMRAQALFALGREAEGAEALEERLALGPPTPALAFWVVRHFGLARRDLPRAKRIVADLEASGARGSAEAVVRCELWLANFCEADPDASVASWLAIIEQVRDPSLRGEMEAAAGAVIMMTSGPAAAVPLAAASLRDTGGGPWSPSRGRALTAAALQALTAGQVATAMEHVGTAMDQGRLHHDIETVLWIGGAGALTAVILGRLEDALAISRPMVGREVEDEGWFGFAGIRQWVHLGLGVYRGDRPELPDLEVAHAPGALPGVWARAIDLATGRRDGRHADDALLRVLRLLGDRGHGTYAALLAAECLDLDASADVHRAVAGLLSHELGGLMGHTGDAARARLSADAGSLLALAREAEHVGWVLPAMRLYRDVVQLSDGNDALGRAGRLGVLRVLHRWDGPDPWFLPVVPTPRQRQIAWSLASGSSTHDIAAQLGLSPRTVENHLQRVYDHVSIHDRAALTDALTAPP